MLHLRTLCAATLIAGLTSCSSESVPTQPETGNQTLQFHILNFHQTSLDDVTRATEADSLKHLDLAVYDAQADTLVLRLQTNKGDEGYGHFAPTLPYGKYNLVFLGYDGARQVILTDLHAIRFEGYYVPNLFSKALPITVDGNTASEQGISLKRSVAAFSVKHSGYIPSTLDHITIAANGGGQVLNGITGYAATTTPMTQTYNLTGQVGKTSFTINSYTFLPTEETTMDFIVTAFDANDHELAKHEFKDVNMKINQRSTFSGAFFGSTEGTPGFAITLENAEWANVESTY